MRLARHIALNTALSSLPGATLKGALAVLLVLFLHGCVSTGSAPSRYQQHQDSAPLGTQDLAKVPDAVPRVEPRSRGGNKSPYTVRGKSYEVLPTALGYSTIGNASWYGAKFHGHLTSNGETYNMFGMSAAHRSLPIPSYVEVTNLANGRKVIVRVNDRGPFHSERLLDLSYAAAVKLGFVDQGTARVKITTIDPISWNKSRYEQVPGGDIYLQAGAFASLDSAEKLRQRLQGVTGQAVKVTLEADRGADLHKVRIGPFANLIAAEAERNKISVAGLGSPLIITLPKS